METPERFSKFVGAKNAPGTYHRIINLIPPCAVFLEPFAGTAAITRLMRPVRETILIDKINRPELRELARKRAGVRFLHADGIAFVKTYKFRGGEMIYADPPYLLAARNQRGRAYYTEEMTDADHERLLKLLRAIPCRVLLSGYRSPLYDDLLCDWQRLEFEVMTRGGTMAKEVLWWNYPRPVTLHDYRLVGDDWKHRANLRRKIKRAVADLASMPAIERNAMFSAMVATVGVDALRAVVDAEDPKNSRLAPKITLPVDTRDSRPVAVLFAREDSIYKTFPGVDVWDKPRDARQWPGGCPIVAHPPCRSWGSLKHQAKPEPGERELAIEAVAQIRRWGGVLEHPAASELWAACALPEPGMRDAFGGFTLEVPQFMWGHRAEKFTRFYVCGCAPEEMPPVPDRAGVAAWYISPPPDVRKGDTNWKPNLRKPEREMTPPALALWLLDVARRCVPPSSTLAGTGDASSRGTPAGALAVSG